MSHFSRRLSTEINRLLYRRVARKVLELPPATTAEDGPIIASMVSARDWLMYLCAVKSFAGHLPGRRYIALDDGTLTVAQRALLQAHVQDLEIRHVDDIDTGPAPRGGCWERLIMIADLNRDAYVIQLDSDTLTLGPVPEVARCVAAGESFALVTEPETRLASAAEAAARAARVQGDYLQFAVERRFADLPDASVCRYIRGCAAFSGFAKEAARREAIFAFSQAMQQTMGQRWSEWGTEQVASNWTIANAPKVGLIPFPRYRNYEGKTVAQDTAFLHFIGTYRFRDRFLREATRIVLRRLGHKLIKGIPFAREI